MSREFLSAYSVFFKNFKWLIVPWSNGGNPLITLYLLPELLTLLKLGMNKTHPFLDAHPDHHHGKGRQ